jgi:putative SOS response-associated peptidase YedK
MCGRFTDMYTWEQLWRLYMLSVGFPQSNMQPNYNHCPTDPTNTILLREGKRVFERMRWGLIPQWWNKPLKELRLATFNARAETVDTKPFFRGAFTRNRCLIPVSGYYEWHYDEPENKKKKPQPYYFTARDGSPILTTAGLWDEWKDRQSGETIRSCTMIITEPNQFVAEVHDRMPVLLRPDQFDAWLDGSAGKEMLVPAAEDMLNKVPVSQRVNSSRAPNDDPTLIEPIRLEAA